MSDYFENVAKKICRKTPLDFQFHKKSEKNSVSERSHEVKIL